MRETSCLSGTDPHSRQYQSTDTIAVAESRLKGFQETDGRLCRMVDRSAQKLDDQSVLFLKKFQNNRSFFILLANFIVHETNEGPSPQPF